jgi:DNA-damage-inducible protein J
MAAPTSAVQILQKILANGAPSTHGLSLSDAVRLMMIRIAREGALPFEPLIPNKETIRAINEVRAGKTKRFGSVSELFADLKAEEPDEEDRDDEEVQERLQKGPSRTVRS